MEPASRWEVVEDVQFVEVATQLTVRVFFIEVNLYSRRLNIGEGNSNKKNHSPKNRPKYIQNARLNLFMFMFPSICYRQVEEQEIDSILRCFQYTSSIHIGIIHVYIHIIVLVLYFGQKTMPSM